MKNLTNNTNIIDGTCTTTNNTNIANNTHLIKKNHLQQRTEVQLPIRILLILFLANTIIRGLLGDFPKALRIYPDELLYVSLGRSLLHGQGLLVHNLNSNFQKILYSLCLAPAFLFQSTVTQIRSIGYINSLIVSSSLFPVYKLSRELLGSTKKMGLILIFWATLPTSLVSLYFMSEVTFLPLSLWLIYCVWCILRTEDFGKKLRLNLLLGLLICLAYLNKEIALYFLISYFIMCIVRLSSNRKSWRQDIICLLAAVGTFVFCFLIMKSLLFSGLNNPYGSSLLRNVGAFEKIFYLLYAVFHNSTLAVLAFGIFPVLIPLATFDRKSNESYLYLFLLLSLLIGCFVISFMITLREDFDLRAPRQLLRYLEPLLIPFYILMINCSEQLKECNRNVKYRGRFLILTLCTVAFIILFIVLGAGGGSTLIDNTTLVYYEFFMRFVCKSDSLQLLIRAGMAGVLIAGLFMLRTNYDRFIRLFCILFIALNVLNSGVGYLACLYRYHITDDQRLQASAANDYLQSLEGNILLISSDGIESEDSRLFDTYVDRDFYVTEVDLLNIDGLLEDNVLDLTSETIRCNYPYRRYYEDLEAVRYLVVKDSYGILFQDSSVADIPDFPMTGYHLYRNLDETKIHFR